MFAEAVSSVLSGLLAFWLGANNVSVIIGHAVGFEPKRRKALFAVFAAGVFLGLAFESRGLSRSIIGRLISAEELAFFSTSILFSATILLAVSSYLGYPLSLVQSLVGGSVGAAFVLNYQIDSFTLLEFSLAWVVAPLASAALTLIAYPLLRTWLDFEKDVISSNKLLALISALAVGYASYSLGASALSLLLSLTFTDPLISHLILLVGIVSGAILASWRVTRSFSFMLAGLTPAQAVASQASASAVVHMFSRLSIPVSVVHASLGWVFVAPFTHSFAIVNWRLVARFLYQWMLTPFLSAITAGATTYILLLIF